MMVAVSIAALAISIVSLVVSLCTLLCRQPVVMENVEQDGDDFHATYNCKWSLENDK